MNNVPIKKPNIIGRERDDKGRFLPGNRGNPNARGRPPNELCITNIQREMLSQPCPYAEGKTWAQWLARRGMELAGENPAYYRELMDRLEGKVVQPIGGDPNMPIVTQIVAHIPEDKNGSNNSSKQSES